MMKIKVHTHRDHREHRDHHGLHCCHFMGEDLWGRAGGCGVSSWSTPDVGITHGA